MCVEKTTLVEGSFFLFSACILYTKVVNIMSLSGTHHQKEPFGSKGSDEVLFSVICSFLYILDKSAFSLEVIEATMYKKRTFYTYAKKRKIYIYW